MEIYNYNYLLEGREKRLGQCSGGPATSNYPEIALVTAKEIGMGGIRSFFIESKLIQQVLEEGGSFFVLQIFKRGKHFMRSVFMGEKATQWLMAKIEISVIDAI